MKNGLTEMVFILDRSGSMSGLEKDTIGGFNSLIRKQRGEEGEAYVSVVLFDHESAVVHDRVDVRKIEPMTDRDYFVRGSTALLDALGGAIRHIVTAHRYAREDDRPGKTIFVITTDGMENSSRRWTYREVRKLVEHEKEVYGWEFLFLGANMDAISAAGKMGISADRAVRYEHDSIGTALNFEVVSEAVCAMRCDAPLEASWKDEIDRDYQRRHRE